MCLRLYYWLKNASRRKGRACCCSQCAFAVSVVEELQKKRRKTKAGRRTIKNENANIDARCLCREARFQKARHFFSLHQCSMVLNTHISTHFFLVNHFFFWLPYRCTFDNWPQCFRGAGFKVPLFLAIVCATVGKPAGHCGTWVRELKKEYESVLVGQIG